MEPTADDSTPPLVEQAGPLDHMDYNSLETLLASHPSPPQNPGTEVTPEQNVEQALESHEVMELQAFSERKEWIMEKIKVCIQIPLSSLFFCLTISPKKLLESMPPIELFADLDAVRASAAAVSGIPTREQLDQWLIEHEKIERETEIFDSGELKKFKNFTMGQC